MATVFMAIGSAVTATASAATSVFGGASAAAAGSSAVTMSQVLSAGSALAAIGQGVAASRTARDEAAFARAQAHQEKAQGAAQARDLAREYAALVGEQKTIQLANGLDIGVGTPVSVAQSTKSLADRNLSVTRDNANNRAAMARLRSRGLMSEARSSLLGGFGRAAEVGLDAYQLTG
jgi:hypothetical protein